MSDSETESKTDLCPVLHALHCVEHCNDLVRMRKIINDDVASLSRRCESDYEFLFYNTYPLHHAILMKHVKCVKLLLELGADPNLYDSERHTNPMLLTLMDLEKDMNDTALSKTELIVELLIKHGVSANVPSENKKICRFQYILYAIHGKSVKITKMLLEHGCEIENFDVDNQGRNIINNFYSTSLKDAIIFHNLDSFKLLLLYNASQCFYFPYGENPFPIANFIIDSHIMVIFSNEYQIIYKFLYVFYLHGGNFWDLVPNKARQMLTIPQRIRSFEGPECIKILADKIEQLMTTPLSLQNQCRLKFKKIFQREYCKRIELLPLPQDIISILRFSELD